jgi:acyl-CoA synthetase (AMP-forming)/AMP-acid ligase II/AcrR family transcriptional regulator
MPTELVDSPWRAVGDRQRHRVAKKDAVLLAAARLFTARGFAGTSLDDIAASLSVTKPTLYHYVANKEEILFECVRRGLAALREGIDESARLGLAGRERLRHAMQRYAEIVTSDFGLCVIRVGEDPLSEPRRRELRALKGEVDTEFRTLIEEGMAEGWIVHGDASMAAYTVVGALSGIGRWYRPDSHATTSLADAVRHCIEMLMRGVLGAPLAPAASRRGDDNMPHQPAMRREVHFDERVLRCFAPRPSNLAQMLAAAVGTRPDAEALVCDDLRLSWRELHHAATKCAAGLAARSVQPGDRVATHLGNGPEFVIVAYAAAWLGAVLVPISARARSAELDYALNDSGAVAIVCAEELADQLPASVPQLKHRFVTGHGAEGFEPFRALTQAEPLATAHAASDEELAVLLYTSGTTGKPKGAMLTHLNIAHSVMHYALAMGLTADDRSAVAVPLSHVTGLVAQLYTMLYIGGCAVVMRQFKAAEFVRLAARERITHAIMVPAMYNLCLLLPDLPAHDLGAWRIGAYGGASMPTATIDGMAARLPGLTLMNAYGATETCSPATIMPPGQTAEHRDSVGLPVPCGDIHVVDDTGNEVPRGQAGEIWISGPMVVPGYWKNEAATASEFRGGYWRSGDIGSMDADGYLRILDRKKDVINRGGYKIYCAQVENTLAEHPQVIEAALVGVPCAVLGERVHAYVCVRDLNDGTQAQALAAYCAARLSDYAVPETWTIGTEPLPRNLNGKVMKRELRQTLHAALT